MPCERPSSGRDRPTEEDESTAWVNLHAEGPATSEEDVQRTLWSAGLKSERVIASCGVSLDRP